LRDTHGFVIHGTRVGCRLAFANLLNFAVWRKNPHANDVEPARNQKPLKGDDYGPTGPAGRPVRAAGQPAEVQPPTDPGPESWQIVHRWRPGPSAGCAGQ
jgi:hypothetical protein